MFNGSEYISAAEVLQLQRITLDSVGGHVGGFWAIKKGLTLL